MARSARHVETQQPCQHCYARQEPSSCLSINKKSWDERETYHHYHRHHQQPPTPPPKTCTSASTPLSPPRHWQPLFSLVQLCQPTAPPASRNANVVPFVVRSPHLSKLSGQMLPSSVCLFIDVESIEGGHPHSYNSPRVRRSQRTIPTCISQNRTIHHNCPDMNHIS